MRHDSLTPRQAQIMSYILRCWLGGFIPTVREIGDEFGIGSLNGVMCHLRAFEKKGFITWFDKRGFSINDSAFELV